MKTNPRIARVTGGNRGIGLEVCRQLARCGDKVLLGARDRAKGEDAARKLSGDVEVIVLDVADPDAAQRVANEVKTRYGRLDVLVNNAGVHYDTWQSVETADWKIVREGFEVNVFGAWAHGPGVRAYDAKGAMGTHRQRVIGSRLACFDGRWHSGVLDHKSRSECSNSRVGR